MASTAPTDHLVLRGTLTGHGGWVTALATSMEVPDMLLSASRDKSLILWTLTREDEKFGVAKRRLKGHSHYVQDVAISSDGQFALSASWDKTLRLWDLEMGKSTRRFEGHTNDVLSVAFSPDNRQIVSGSRDKTIKLWNTLAQCKYTINAHNDWVSCVRFLPTHIKTPVVVSAGWDKHVKVWYLPNCQQLSDYQGHSGYLNCVTVSPDGSLCASGGKDFKVMLWDLNENKHLYTLDHKEIINAMCFSPNRYWLCVATGSTIKIWDLEGKEIVNELKPEIMTANNKERVAECVSLTWSTDGHTLYTGHTDNCIRVWQVGEKN